MASESLGERWEHSEGIRGVVVYNTDLFDEATITRMLGYFKTLLEDCLIHKLNCRLATPERS